MASNTKFLCPTCGKRMKMECYTQMPCKPKFEIFCEDGHFISCCNSARAVNAECEATCMVSTIRIVEGK